jgi:hypothetical protein
MVIRDGTPVAAQSGVVAADDLVEALDRVAATSAETAGVQEAT